MGTLGAAVVQLLYGVFYYFVIVQNYPDFAGEPSQESIDVQRKNEVTACLTCEHSCPITLTSWLCYAARAAHTYDKVGTCAYWPGLIAGIFFPCCTLCYMNA